MTEPRRVARAANRVARQATSCATGPAKSRRYAIAHVEHALLVMTRMLLAVLIVAALVGTPLADTPLPIEGTYGFNVFMPKKKCKPVKGALLALLRSKYTCELVESEGASGRHIFARCTAKRGRSEFLLLATAKACEDERETQLANE